MRLLDLYCGRGWGWSRGFAERGHECVGVDILPRAIAEGNMPKGARYIRSDVLDWYGHEGAVFCQTRDFMLMEEPDVIVASSPCEGFAVFGMRNFHKNPPWPHLAITLFNHTKTICEQTKLPYVMENVRAAQRFVGKAAGHAGSFYLWGNAVPKTLPRVTKGFKHTEMFAHDRTNRAHVSATIPLELSRCVADYAERLLESRVGAGVSS